MDAETESEAATTAIKALGSLFKLTQVFLWDDFTMEAAHNDNFSESRNSCNRPPHVNSSLDGLINECTPSLEDLELSQQMNALGLPVSFSTSKKGDVVKKVKRKGNTEKPQFVHENDEDGTKGVSKLENGEVVSPTNFHDKRNVSLCSIPTMTQCETLYSHNAEEVNEPLLTFKDEGLLSMTTKICNAAGLKEACEETGSVVENCGNHVNIPVSTMSNRIEEAAANPIDGDYEYSPDTSVPRDLMDTKLVRSRSSTGLETEKLCVDGTSKQTCIPDSVVSSESSVVTEHILVNESGNYEQCKDLGNWKTFWDAYYERVYYYNMETNESTWYPPPGVDYLAFSDSKGEPTAMVIDPSKTDDKLLCRENKFQNPCDVQGYGISLLECCYEHLDQPDGVTVFSKVRSNCEEEEAPFCSTISDKQNDGDSLSAQLSQLGSEVWSSDPPLLSMDSKIDAVDANNNFDGLEKIISCEDAYKIFDDSIIQVSDADIFSEMNGNDMQLEDVICTTDALDNKHGSATRKKKKKVRRMRRKVFSNENEGLEHESMPEEFSDDITKYWCQRYSLFSRFDDGIKMDEEGWFSVTPELIAKHHATRCGSGVIIDCFTGVGGNAIQLAKRSNNVIAIDIDPQKIEYAQHNAAIYGVDGSIDFINGDFFQLAPKLKAETVFLSPPWGGPDYVKVWTYDINTMLKPCDGHILFNTSRAIASKIIMFLPRNVNLNQLAELSLSANPPWALEVEKNFLNGKLKAITAYFSDTPL